MLQLVFGNADACIFYLHHQDRTSSIFRIFFFADADIDIAFLRSKLQCIRQQVGYDLAEFFRIVGYYQYIHRR